MIILQFVNICGGAVWLWKTFSIVIWRENVEYFDQKVEAKKIKQQYFIRRGMKRIFRQMGLKFYSLLHKIFV